MAVKLGLSKLESQKGHSWIDFWRSLLFQVSSHNIRLYQSCSSFLVPIHPFHLNVSFTFKFEELKQSADRYIFGHSVSLTPSFRKYDLTFTFNELLRLLGSSLHIHSKTLKVLVLGRLLFFSLTTLF